MEGKIISVVNIKGGVGKSTTVCCLSELLAAINKKILIVDLDPQSNSSQLFGRYRTSEKTVIDLFTAKPIELKNYETIVSCIQSTEYSNIDIIASEEELTFVCDMISNDISRIQQKILSRSLHQLKQNYDFILIDNSPYYNLITSNALCASDYVLTPVEADGFGYSGLSKLLEKIYSIKDELNENLEFLGVFLNKVNKQTTLFKNLYQNYTDELGERFIKQYIRHDNRAKESATAFIPLFHYDKKCKAIQDYKDLLINLNILNKDDIKKLESIFN